MGLEEKAFTCRRMPSAARSDMRKQKGNNRAREKNEKTKKVEDERKRQSSGGNDER